MNMEATVDELKPGPKYWRSRECDHAEVVEPQDSHNVGDTEPCIHCGDLRCYATVEQGAIACIVVGSSPPNEYSSSNMR